MTNRTMYAVHFTNQSLNTNALGMIQAYLIWLTIYQNKGILYFLSIAIPCVQYLHTGVYVFHVTSVAASSNMVATPLLLLRNEVIVLETGKFTQILQ